MVIFSFEPRPVSIEEADNYIIDRLRVCQRYSVRSVFDNMKLSLRDRPAYRVDGLPWDVAVSRPPNYQNLVVQRTDLLVISIIIL